MDRKMIRLSIEAASASFNWATTFQSWIGQPFLGLCRYRKKAEKRGSTGLPNIFWILAILLKPIRYA
jgi:hypothetical protein